MDMNDSLGVALLPSFLILFLFFPLYCSGGLAQLQSIMNRISTRDRLPSLALDHLGIKDITPFSLSLFCLTELSLTGNNIKDVVAFSSLINLTRLELGTNQIADVAPLSTLTSLTQLNLSENNIGSVAPLSTITSLTQLNLSKNHILDVAPLRTLPKLRVLNLCNNELESSPKMPVLGSD
jgi:Leucine-rich repeat (LRR) protein